MTASLNGQLANAGSVTAAGRLRRQRGFFGGPLMLIVLGVLILLALRFLPLAEWIDGPTAQRADSPEPPVDVVVAPPPPDATLSKPVVAPRVVEARPAPITPEPTTPEPSTAPVTLSKPTAVVAKPAPVAAQPPGTVAAPVKPNLRVLVEADVHDRAGLAAFTPASYAARLRDELEQVAARQLGPDAVTLGGSNLPFRSHIEAGRGGVESLCEQAGSQRLLLADLRIPSAGFSTVDSAYWPEVAFVAINCADGRVHRRPKKRIEPTQQDRFEFQYQFAKISGNFVASQGYFLRP